MKDTLTDLFRAFLWVVLTTELIFIYLFGMLAAEVAFGAAACGFTLVAFLLVCLFITLFVLYREERKLKNSKLGCQNESLG